MATVMTTLDLVDPTPAQLKGVLTTARLPLPLIWRVAGRYVIRAPIHESGAFTIEPVTVAWRREAGRVLVRVEIGEVKAG